jgi:hypothetical protein
MTVGALTITRNCADLKLELVATFPNMRALAWDRGSLYAARGYKLFRARMNSDKFEWREAGNFRPEWWRAISSQFALTFRLLRDGFHAVAITRSGNIIAAVPGAILTKPAGEAEFRITHRLLRGTRPLHIVATPDGRLLWGEYFDNPRRDEVHIYASEDCGLTWHVAYTFPKHSIRHVHNIVYDRWQNCLWGLTGDYGSECRILQASLDFSSLEEILCGNQQARSVAAIVTEEGLYFASDTPLEQNFIYSLDRAGRLHRLASIPSSSICAGRNRSGMFFSTMVEPSKVNLRREVTLFGSINGENWNQLAAWKKDAWSEKYCQYGNAFIPDGENHTEFLAVSTIAVKNADLQTTIWRTRFE